jgi:hypothetical protein
LNYSEYTPQIYCWRVFYLHYGTQYGQNNTGPAAGLRFAFQKSAYREACKRTSWQAHKLASEQAHKLDNLNYKII